MKYTIETMPKLEENESLEEIARENFNRWNEALKTKNSEAVAALYETELLFLPTLLDDLIEEPAGTAEYFEHFLKNSPSGEIIKSGVKRISDNAYAHAGLYDFTIIKDGKKEVIHAKFSMDWMRSGDNEEWKIAVQGLPGILL